MLRCLPWKLTWQCCRIGGVTTLYCKIRTRRLRESRLLAVHGCLEYAAKVRPVLKVLLRFYDHSSCDATREDKPKFSSPFSAPVKILRNFSKNDAPSRNPNAEGGRHNSPKLRQQACTNFACRISMGSI